MEYKVTLGSILIEIIKVLPAWIGSLCAIYGLKTWRHQLHYREQHELARRLLLAIYRYRDSIQHARYPFRIEAPPIDQTKTTRKEHELEIWTHKYKAIDTAKSHLEAELTEAEAILGHRFEESIEKLYRCDGDLLPAVTEHIQSIDKPSDHHLNDELKYKKRRKVLYCASNSKDEFSVKLKSVIKEIEGRMLPLLGRKHQRDPFQRHTIVSR